MDRRTLLAALAGAMSACVVPAQAGAGTLGRGVIRAPHCAPIGGAQACTVGFSGTPPLLPDPCRGRAWALALVYILQGFGVSVTPDDVLLRAGLSNTGCSRHDPALDHGLLHATSGTWTDRAGKAFNLGFAQLPSLHTLLPTDPEFPRLLARLARQPLLCGAAGHTTVITALTLEPGLAGTTRRGPVTVRDPHLPTGGLRYLTEDELAQPFWVLGVSVRPLSTS